VERQLTTDDLCEDIKLGVLPIELFEILSRSSCGRYVKAPKTSFQKLDNFNIFLEQLKSKSIKLANIGAEDLAGGVRKAVLGLTWTLILTYEVNKLLGEKAGINDLLNWVKEKVKPYGVILEGGWQKGFADGQAFCALGMPFHTARAFPQSPCPCARCSCGAPISFRRLYPLRLHASVHLHVCAAVHDTDSTALDLAASKQMLPAQRLTLAFRAAEKVLGVPQLLDPGDFFMTDGKNDEKSIILYVAKLKQGFQSYPFVQPLVKSLVKPATPSKPVMAKDGVLAAELARQASAEALAVAHDTLASSQYHTSQVAEAKAAEAKVEAETAEMMAKAGLLAGANAQSSTISAHDVHSGVCGGAPVSEAAPEQKLPPLRRAARHSSGGGESVDPNTGAAPAADQAVLPTMRRAGATEGVRAAYEDGMGRMLSYAEAAESKTVAEAEVRAGEAEAKAKAAAVAKANADAELVEATASDVAICKAAREVKAAVEAATAKAAAARDAATFAAAAAVAAAEAAKNATTAAEAAKAAEKAAAALKTSQKALLQAQGAEDEVVNAMNRVAQLASIEAMGFEAASEVAVAEASAKLAQRTAASHALDADREAAFAAAAAATAQDAHRVVAVREAALTTAKARLHELRETLLSEVAELRDWLGVRMERYEQASMDPSKTLLGSTEDESRALLDSLKNDRLLELPARGDKRRELKERCVRLESMKAQYDIEMGIRSYITPPVGSADGGAKEAFATLDAMWDLMSASAIAYETALEARVVELEKPLRVLLVSKSVAAEWEAYLASRGDGGRIEPSLVFPWPPGEQPPTPPPRSAQKSLQSRKDGTSAVTGASTGGDEVAREAAAMKELTRVTAERDEARAMVKALMKEGGSGRGADGTERRDERSFCKAIATCFSPKTPAAPTIVPSSSPD
jgi:hypothetical protein